MNAKLDQNIGFGTANAMRTGPSKTIQMISRNLSEFQTAFPYGLSWFILIYSKGTWKSHMGCGVEYRLDEHVFVAVSVFR